MLFAQMTSGRPQYPRAGVVSANLLIECIARSGRRDAVSRCEGVLLQAQAQSQSLDGSRGEARQGLLSKTGKQQPTRISSAQRISDGTVESVAIVPDDYTFSLMMRLWTENECGDIADRAQALFDRIQSAAAASASATAYSSASRSSPRHFGPSVATYSALVDAWADRDPTRAAQILDLMSDKGMAAPTQLYSKVPRLLFAFPTDLTLIMSPNFHRFYLLTAPVRAPARS
jgi:hypothetical protein